MPITPHIMLPESVRDTLIAMTKNKSSKSKVIRRALVLLELNTGKSYREVASILHIGEIAVAALAKKYRTIVQEANDNPTDEQRYSVLYDKERSGRPPRISGDEQAKITALACSKPPKGHGQWSLRLLADKVVELEYCDRISHTSVGNILKKTNCSLTESDIGVLV
jgi:transposase